MVFRKSREEFAHESFLTIFENYINFNWLKADQKNHPQTIYNADQQRKVSKNLP